jgi:glutamine synthetase
MNAVDLGRIRVLFPDTFGFTRDKYVPVAEATGESNFSRTVFGIGYDRDLIPAPGATVLEGIGDIRAIYNPATNRPSWQKRTEIVIADLYTEGQPLDIAPRSALRKAVKALSERDSIDVLWLAASSHTSAVAREV